MVAFELNPVQNEVIGILSDSRISLARMEIGNKLPVQQTKATLVRYLDELVKEGYLAKEGDGPKIKYRFVTSHPQPQPQTPSSPPLEAVKISISQMIPPVINNTARINKSSLPPLVSFSITNPVTYLKLFWKRVMSNEGIDLRLKIKPLTAITIVLGFLGISTSLGIGAGWWLNTLAKTPIVGQFVPLPNTSKQISATGKIQYNTKTRVVYLLTANSQLITLELPDTVAISGFSGKEVIVSGRYDSEKRVLAVEKNDDLQLLSEL